MPLCEDLDAFAAAAATFTQLATASVEAWDRPSVLAGYRISDLVGHVVIGTFAWSATVTGSAGSPVADAAEWYLGGRPELHAAVHAQAAALADRGPEHVLSRLAVQADRAESNLRGLADADAVVALSPVSAAAATVGDFVRTRVVELVVHTDDLAVSLGRATNLPARSVAVAVDALVGMAIRRSGDVEVLRVLTRRERAAQGVLPVL